LEASIGLINRKILKKSRSEQTIYAEAAIPGICAALAFGLGVLIFWHSVQIWQGYRFTI